MPRCELNRLVHCAHTSAILRLSQSRAWPTRQARTEIVEEFREQVTRTVVNIKELLETSTIHALPGELHQLVGQARAIGALKLQAYATRCKSCFTEENLQGVEALLYETLAAMQSANAAAPALSSAADSPFAQPADGPPLVCVGIVSCVS
jgi:HPt (histidine-containing phosphotransfer) domain-containing protein